MSRRGVSDLGWSALICGVLLVVAGFAGHFSLFEHIACWVLGGFSLLVSVFIMLLENS